MSATPDQILEVLAQVAETEEVRTQPDLALYDLQILDSMKTAQLMIALSTELGVNVMPTDFEQAQWATPAKLVEDVMRRDAA